MTYVVTDLSPVFHGGVILTEGQEISGFSDGEAAALLDLGVIKAKTKVVPKDDK